VINLALGIIGREDIWNMVHCIRKKLKRKFDRQLRNAIRYRGFSSLTPWEEVLGVASALI
jgi:hypothetical protein